LLAAACAPAWPGSGSIPEGGTVRVGDAAEPDSMLSAGITGADPNAYAITGPVMEGLLAARPAGGVAAHPHGPADYWRPQLAIRVPTVENGGVRLAGPGMDVTWKLRAGVTWQDGRPFTSRDVWATFQFHWLRYGPHNPTPILSTQGWDQVTGVLTPDPHTAVVHFKSVYGPYLSLGSGPYGIMPAHLLERAWAQGGDLTRTRLAIDVPGAYRGTAAWGRWLVGTGPFMFKDWVPGDHVTLVRNPRWWGPRPHLDYIYIQFQPDPSGELAAVRSGAVDLGLDMGVGALPAIGHVPDFAAQALPAGGVEKIDLNLHNRYLADPAIRRAILMAIDRQAIVDILLDGRTVVPSDSWLCAAAAWCVDPSLPRTRYDPGGARALLAAAGYPVQASGAGRGYRRFGDGSTITLGILAPAGDQMGQRERDVVATDLRRIGIRVRLPARDPSADLIGGEYQDGGLLATHRFDMAITGARYSSPAEPAALEASYACPAAAGPAGGGGQVGLLEVAHENDTFTCEKLLDRALAAGRQTATAVGRRLAYQAAQRVLGSLLPEVPLYRLITVQAVSAHLHGYRGNAFYWLQGCQDWWVSG
ncbi:MAG: ABC transporter substrate-binding protein, partial [Candidatus Dormibacteraceae bacterium]